MDFSVALTLVQTLLQLLDSSSPILRQIESVRGFKSQLKKLKQTMRMIQAVLEEAERQQRQQQEFTFPLQETLGNLNEVLYDADDLFDEVATLTQLKNHMSGNIVSKEVRQFFSRFNQLKYALTKSLEIKNIRERLDDIAKDYKQFGIMVQQQVGRRSENNSSNPRETSSLLCKDDVIIGRDGDKRVLIEMLLDTVVEESGSCVSIVGIGGLGKTTLARDVYNDEEIVREFGLRMWVCVSNDFDVSTLLGAILAAATNQPRQGGLSLDQVHRHIQQELDGKKYLLVLDDVWDDIVSKWDEIRKPLVDGWSRGSRILVTTRLADMADNVGGKTHELKGLSVEDSWNLFETMTLKSRKETEALNGENILKKCAGVPLAIRVVGSYLRHQSEKKWTDVGNTILANVGDNKDIMHVLMISYYDLPFHLKRCFSYCAIFPKDYVIIKEDLIYMWIAQGFIKPNGRSLEDVGEECFIKLLARCFFQDAKRGDDGEIISCKMHDLIHDIATNIASNEMMLAIDRCDVKAEVRHLFIEGKVLTRENTKMICTRMKRMRSILYVRHNYLDSLLIKSTEISKARNLRLLSFPDYCFGFGSEKEVAFVGVMMHLRYLDLSNNKFFMLPSSISGLLNLQTLKLRHCDNLERLPEDLSKLVNLRCLDLIGCDGLQYMPPGMRSMTCLHKLTMFVLGNSERNKLNFSGSVRVSGLEDLKCLTSLTGTLEIRIQDHWIADVAKVEGAYLSNLEDLKRIEIMFGNWRGNNEEALLEILKPNHNLQAMKLFGCPNMRFPCWGMMGILSRNIQIILPNLVEIYIEECTRLEQIPLMSQLPKLRVLHLRKLHELKYVECSSDGDGTFTDLKREADNLIFFPSLEILELEGLPQLKGWASHSNSYVFPCLKKLSIVSCGNLSSFPLCLEGLEALDVTCPSNGKGLSFNDKSGKKYMITSVNCAFVINYLPEIFHHLTCLEIRKIDDVERLLIETREVFRMGRMSSLLSLDIRNCSKLKRLSELREMWGHLTSLETLKLGYLQELELEWEEEDENSREREITEEDNHVIDFDMSLPWKILTHTLRHLTLEGLPKLYKLPRGLQCLTSLLSLELIDCKNLEELSHIGCLTSLDSLVLQGCKKLKTLPQEMCHLTALETLDLENLPELELKRVEEEENDVTTSVLPPSLRYLTLYYLPKLVKLPLWMNHLTSLHSLQINWCDNLEELPVWIGNFTSLHTLYIRRCKKLERLPQKMCLITSLQYLTVYSRSREFLERYQKPSGANWPDIKHIPDVIIKYRE